MNVRSTVNFSAVENKLRAAMGLYVDSAAKKVEGHAKGNKSWTDRTGNAKNSIQGSSGWRGDSVVVNLSGNTDYFVYLELAMAKRYAILAPTMQSQSSDIISGFRKVIS